ncbi:MAG: hypothetical protein LBR60_08810 [Fibrobacter sp.]|jgi:ABC-type glycerol-3-phosphate transport system substrate-binding protein|nr:hypothetical protein [Fibrobacter sp.]
MMKNILTLILFAFLFGLAACSGSKSSDSGTPDECLEDPNSPLCVPTDDGGDTPLE